MISNPKPIRMIDIADQANVSRMAVSAVLMGTGKGTIRVSDDKAAEIRSIAAELGYQPNHAAQQLAGKKSGVIAAMANDWFYPVEVRIFSWLQKTLDEMGYRVLATQSNGKIEPVSAVVGELNSRGVEGLLYVAFGNESQWAEAKELLHGVPHVVSILGDLGDPNISSVLSDVEEGAAQVVQHLAERGRKKIVMVVENDTAQMNRKRIEGFKNEHRKLGLEFSEDQICIATEGWHLSEISYDDWDNLLDNLLNTRNADALLADSDYGAVGLLKALRRQQYKVPEDISLVGWGNEVIAGVFDPTISTVSYPINDVVQQAVKLLLGQIEDRTSTNFQTIHVKPELIIRETS